MKMKYRITKYTSQQQGIALLSLIFIMVVIGGALLQMSRLSSQQNITNNLAVQAARAKWAAMSGLHYAAFEIDQDPDPKACPTGTPLTYNLGTDAGDLNGFSVTITCDEQDFAADGIQLFVITSTAEYGDLTNPNYAYRSLEVIMEENPD